MTVSFLPNVVRCELCPLGIAAAVIDSVWVCEECAQVLGVFPSRMRTPAVPPRRVEPRSKAPSGQWLLDAITVLSRAEK
jgi:hypothetical protein